jgi:hypothetical protein
MASARELGPAMLGAGFIGRLHFINVSGSTFDGFVERGVSSGAVKAGAWEVSLAENERAINGRAIPSA